MRFSTRVFTVVLVTFLVTVAIAPLLKGTLDWVLGIWPQTADLLHLRLDGEQYDFGRAFRRMFMLCAVVSVLLFRRWLGPVAIHGIDRDSRPVRRLGIGLLVGIVSWCVLLAVLVAAGIRSWGVELPADWVVRIGLALVAALLVGLIEETALRGYLLGGLLRDWPVIAAVLLSSGIYSLAHFFRAGMPVRVGGWDPGIGLEALVLHFRQLGRPGVLLGFVGLLLVGVVLAYAYLWTRSLPYVIGLHAGWVFLMMIDGFLFSGPPVRMLMFGERGPGAVLLLCGFLLLMLAILYLGLRRFAPKYSGPQIR